MGAQRSKLQTFDGGDVIYRHLNSSGAGSIGYHYGIYVTDDEVIECSRGGVRRTTLYKFSKDGKYKVSKEKLNGARSPDEIVEKVQHFSNHPEEWKKFNLLTNNCEHFVQFCATGKKRSNQVLMGTGFIVDRIGSRFHRTSSKGKKSNLFPKNKGDTQIQMKEMVRIIKPNIEDSALMSRIDGEMPLQSVLS